MTIPTNELLKKSGELKKLIADFEKESTGENFRTKVLSLIPVFHKLREIGKAILPNQSTASARDRILFYFRKYPLVVINGDELLVVSGIQEYARRIRELRKEFGWQIISGVTAKDMFEEGDLPLEKEEAKKMGTDDYMLLSEEQDRDAALRWNIANEIRRSKESVRDKILAFLKRNVAKPVTGEELRYVAKDRTEWARRVRELRTEFGWPIVSRQTGRPELPIGVYLLESLRQSPVHDRVIPDDIRGNVLRRDGYKCTACEWSHEDWNPSDPRHLELHHIHEHAKGGANTEENLKTLCTVCHDKVHRKSKG